LHKRKSSENFNPMKKFTPHFTGIFLLTALVVISSCKKDGCTDSTAINYNSKANVNNGTCQYDGSAVFYVSNNGPAITVTITNGTTVTSQQATISQGAIFNSSTVSCGATGCATFTSLPVGNYTYAASSALFNWTGTFVVGSQQCTNVMLQQSTASLTFWMPTSNNGTITVTVSGYSPLTITSPSSSNPGCNAPGCANFILPLSTSAYSYTASGSVGGSWQGTDTLSTQGQCATVELQ
jgi:hypothetical protein